MRIGYACLTVGVPDTAMKSCVMKNADETRLYELIAANLVSLDHILDYNIDNHITLFRISSDLIPFGSSPVNTLKWWEVFEDQFLKLGAKIKKNGIRVSMHPGQYTVLNSPNEEVVVRAVQDLHYHAKVLDCLGTSAEHKIILHIGGVYNDKKQAIEAFQSNYEKLDSLIKQRLVIENDDKSYCITDVLSIGLKHNIPVVFDNLHHKANPSKPVKTEKYWIDKCRSTWRNHDGNQKIHYSQQNFSKKLGSHSSSITINEFMEFYQTLGRTDLDIMLEVKDKNLSAVKCINCTSSDRKTTTLEKEWSKYKYSVLEKSHTSYNEIRMLLKDKENYPALSFYNLLETALTQELTIGGCVNAAMHVWGYFKDSASITEKNRFLQYIEDYQQEKISIQTIKNHLWKLTVKYQEDYLLNSYYFIK